MPIPYIDPQTGRTLERTEHGWSDPQTGRLVAPVEGGVARFVPRDEHYAASFRRQWARWRTNMYDTPAALAYQRQTVLGRTRFTEDQLRGKTLLECGCGPGNDTRVLLDLPLAEVHSFDLSEACEHTRALDDSGRLVVSQASITAIPYADRSFDVVYCHRVLQHTPDPEASLRSICRKVKPGGTLFVHSYRRSPLFMSSYKYKYRWLTRRLPNAWVAWYVDAFGPMLNALNKRLHAMGPRGRRAAYRWVPFYDAFGAFTHMGPKKELELLKLITFDALTPRYDLPMTPERFRGIIESEGFQIQHFNEDPGDALFATARYAQSAVNIETRTAGSAMTPALS